MILLNIYLVRSESKFLNKSLKNTMSRELEHYTSFRIYNWKRRYISCIKAPEKKFRIHANNI